jgi:hypothetical protein
MKELRPGSSARSEIRILFAFDQARQAILLVAGDKAGNWTGGTATTSRSPTNGSANIWQNTTNE